MTIGLDRRDFLVRTAGLTFALTLGAGTGSGSAARGGAPKSLGTAWVTIHPDDTITIMSAATELGQGSMTALPLIFADEMDADWSKVRVEFSASNDAIYGKPPGSGIMYTAGSSSVLEYITPLRLQAAVVRRVLLDSVCLEWGVAREQLTTEPNWVIHRESGRRIRYGDITQFARIPDPLPEIRETDLKPVSAFRYIGKDVLRVDIPSKVDGSAQFAVDVHLPNMLYGAVLRAPVEGAAPSNIDDGAALNVTGVVKVARLPCGVAVLARTVEAAFEAKRHLKVTWTKVPADRFNSEEALERYIHVARDLTIQGMPSDQDGDVAAGMARAKTILEAEYLTDYGYHAQMEPLNSVASVNRAGDSAEIWAGTQAPTHAVRAAARALGTTPEKITLHRSMTGGAFGRRGHPDQEFVVDSVLLSKLARAPVKVIWTREDDIRSGRFRSMTGQYLRAGLDTEGKVIAWRRRVVGEASLAFQDPVRFKEYGGWTFEMAGAYPYDLPNRLVDFVRQIDGMRLSSLRGIGAPPNAFVIESFLDEIATYTNADPLEFRMRLLEKAPRARAMLQLAAEMSVWRAPRAGRGLGICLGTDSGGTVAGMVAEVSVDKESGATQVNKIWAAVDAGLAIQPDNIVAQVEGAIIHGVGVALLERVTIRDGQVEQNNFHDYRVPRMADVPEIEIRVVATDNPPSGVGELGCSVTGAIANAVAAATRVRVRHMPMTPERVLEAIQKERHEAIS